MLASNHRVFFLLGVSVFVFYVSTLFPGHDWGGDFSHYINHAKNIVEGKPYSDTGYLVNSFAFVGPYVYPPVFSILLAPVYWLFGLDLNAMKWVPVLSLCFALLLIPKLFANRLSVAEQAIVFCLVAFNPYFFELRNRILSDYTFIFFCALSLYWMLRIFSSEEIGWKQLSVNSCILGVFMCLAYGTREAGLVLPLTLLTYEIIFRRRISLVTCLAILIFGVFAYFLQGFLSDGSVSRETETVLSFSESSFHREEELSHFSFVDSSLYGVSKRVRMYLYATRDFWEYDGPIWRVLSVILNGFTLVMAFVGYVMVLLRRITVLEIFFAGYALMLLLFSGSTHRYLMPLIPFVFYYFFIGVHQLGSVSLKPTYKNSILMIYFVATVALYGDTIKSQLCAESEKGILSDSSVEMFNYIQSETDPDAAILFFKPRIMALMTERSCAGLPKGVKEKFSTHEKISDFYESYFDMFDLDYYVEASSIEENTRLKHFFIENERGFEVFRNSDFIIYRRL